MNMKALIKKLFRRELVIQANIANIGMNERLQGKNVVITGGSSGIGLAIAKAAYNAGANVLIIGRNETKIKKTLEDYGDRIHGVICDITNCEKVEKLYDVASQALGGDIDVLVNAAGVISDSCIKADFLSVTESEFDYVLNTNIKGMFFVTQTFIREFLKQKSSRHHILNICSTEGMKGVLVPYGISKWGTVGFTKGIAKKYAKEGIIINGIAPGGTASGMLKKINSDNLKYPVASGRASIPAEIGELAVYMVSNLADNMVGSIVVYDGGEAL